MNQDLRNSLAAIEDAARKARNNQSDLTEADFALKEAFNLIAQLSQIIRQELVR
jgi:hypothetical protein